VARHYVTRCPWAHCVHRGVQRWNNVTGFENGFWSGQRLRRYQQIASSRRGRQRAGARAASAHAQQRCDSECAAEKFATGPGRLRRETTFAKAKKLSGPEAQRMRAESTFGRRRMMSAALPANISWMSPQSAGGWWIRASMAITQRALTARSSKYDAPSHVDEFNIIKGILDQKLPWSLVLFGVMISVVLDFAVLARWPFAFGVYLPISSSAPIFIGGLIRWLVDRKSARCAELQYRTSPRCPGRQEPVFLRRAATSRRRIAEIIIAFIAGRVWQGDDRRLRNGQAHESLFLWRNRLVALSIRLLVCSCISSVAVNPLC